MPANNITQALDAIKASYKTDKGEYGADLFISHHLEELSDADWLLAIGTMKPTPQQILNSLTLSEPSEDGVMYDFTLPNDVTDYILCVNFGEDGTIENISMES